jgi:AraC-like DNA-binding protein
MPAKSEKSDFKVELDRGGTLARRSSQLTSDGAYIFQDELKIAGELSAVVITCTAWLLEIYQRQAGSISFLTGGNEVLPETKCFGVFYPPFSMAKPCFRDVEAHLIGVASSKSVPDKFVSAPLVFDITRLQTPTGVSKVIEILQSGKNAKTVAVNPRPSLLSIRAKRLIDENYLVYPSIGRIADRLGVRHEHLSREFKRDFEMSPSNYLRQLRVADAPLKLAMGEEIISVSQDVGYNDLSRFYKQFRQTTDTSPGVCKTILRARKT